MPWYGPSSPGGPGSCSTVTGSISTTSPWSNATGAAMPGSLRLCALATVRVGHLGAEAFDDLVCLVLGDLDELV